jgi:hypothetical protein
MKTRIRLEKMKVPECESDRQKQFLVQVYALLWFSETQDYELGISSSINCWLTRIEFINATTKSTQVLNSDGSVTIIAATP